MTSSTINEIDELNLRLDQLLAETRAAHDVIAKEARPSVSRFMQNIAKEQQSVFATNLMLHTAAGRMFQKLQQALRKFIKSL